MCQSQDCQRQSNQRQQALGDEENLAAVERICHRSTDQGKDNDRQDARQPDPAQRERVRPAGQVADMPEERRDLHLRAGDGDEQARP